MYTKEQISHALMAPSQKVYTENLEGKNSKTFDSLDSAIAFLAQAIKQNEYEDVLLIDDADSLAEIIEKLRSMIL